MTQYIDKNSLLSLFDDSCKYQNVTNEYQRGCNEMFDWFLLTIKNFKTSDVVERSECEKWYSEYHRIKDEFKQQRMYHYSTERLVDRYRDELLSLKELYKNDDDIQIKLFEKFFLELDTYSCEECTACGKYTLEDHCPEVCLANKIARFFVAAGARLHLDYLHNIERTEGVKNALVED